MKKVKYFYNTNTLRYEKLVTPLRVKLLRVFGFISALLVSSALVIWLYTKFIPKPGDKESDLRYKVLRDDYNDLAARLRQLQQQMAELEKRDNEVYRSIFEANPLPDSARAKLTEKSKEIAKVNVMSDNQLSKDIAAQLNNISARIEYQRNSYLSIEKLIRNQDEKLSSMPAIQPVSVKDLVRISDFFGFRRDPFNRSVKYHHGIDFSGPIGSPIYATGDGVVVECGYSFFGYGNQIIIDHGFGYKTRYAHLHKINIKEGQKVTRGQIIATLGNTGRSTGPHLHYEVLHRGKPVDPLNFFNDITEEEYDRMVSLSTAENSVRVRY